MANQEFAGFLYDNAGDAISGATVELFDRNTTTTARASTTTSSSGYWTISHGTEGRFDVRITNGSSIRFLKYDDAVQLTALEVANFNIRNPADTFDYAITPAAITGDRTLNLPLTTGTDTLMTLGLAQTVTGALTFSTADVTLNDSIALTLGTGGDVDIEYDGTDLIVNARVAGTGNVDFRQHLTWGGGVAITAGDYAIGRNGDGTNLLQANVPSGASHEWSVQDTAELTLSATVLNVLGNDIDMGTNGARIDLDTDNDTSIRCSADDTIMVEIAGTDRLSYTAGTFAFQEATTVSTSAGDMTLIPVGNLIIDASETSQPFAITDRGGGELIVQGQTANAGVEFEVYTKDGDGDGIKLSLFNVGTPSAISNRERLELGAGTVASGGAFFLNINSAGSGTARDFEIRDNNTARITVNAGGTVQLGAALDMNANAITNVGSANNDWGTNTLMHSASYAGVQVMEVGNESGAATSHHGRLTITSTGAGGGDPICVFNISGVDGVITGLDNSASDQYAIASGYALGTNDRLRLNKSTGVLSVDGDGGGSDDPVSLFDDDDDPDLAMTFAYSHPAAPQLGAVTREQWAANRERMVELGLAEWSAQDTGEDRLMIYVQPMLRLLAGGVYQNRAYIVDAVEAMADEVKALRGQVAALTR